MRIIAGLNLKSLHPFVWDEFSVHYLPDLNAVMVSYADILLNRPALKRRSEEVGLHQALGIPEHVAIYLDNGSFHFSLRGIETNNTEYIQFVQGSRPDWHPVPRDFIPTPNMTLDEQRTQLALTMETNRAYYDGGFVPVIHISQVLPLQLDCLQQEQALRDSPMLAIGGLVPQLLRTSRSRPYREILDTLIRLREIFHDKRLHLFGVGGNATLHLAYLLGMDSADSSGWRNRAARGIVQLPGKGDRVVANLGSWKGREPTQEEWNWLEHCPCRACQLDGVEGLRASLAAGFRHRATHNLWTLLEEAKWIEARLQAGNYLGQYQNHLENSIYRPLIDYVAAKRAEQ